MKLPCISYYTHSVRSSWYCWELAYFWKMQDEARIWNGDGKDETHWEIKIRFYAGKAELNERNFQDSCSSLSVCPVCTWVSWWEELDPDSTVYKVWPSLTVSRRHPVGYVAALVCPQLDYYPLVYMLLATHHVHSHTHPTLLMPRTPLGLINILLLVCLPFCAGLTRRVATPHFALAWICCVQDKSCSFSLFSLVCYIIECHSIQTMSLMGPLMNYNCRQIQCILCKKQLNMQYGNTNRSGCNLYYSTWD